MLCRIKLLQHLYSTADKAGDWCIYNLLVYDNGPVRCVELRKCHPGHGLSGVLYLGADLSGFDLDG